eukprot:g20436.t1
MAHSHLHRALADSPRSQDASSLEIIVLTPTDGSGDPLEEVLHPPATQARSQRREPRGPFAERGPTRGPRMSDALPVPSDSSDEFRWSPIEESSESRITVLMRRVDMQATELQSLRRKNEELSEAMDQYNLEQKVSRHVVPVEAADGADRLLDGASAGFGELVA